MIQQGLHITGGSRPIMSIRTRDDLSQFDAGILPTVGFVAITKIIGRARAVKDHQFPEFSFSLQHVSEHRAQGCDTGAHGHEHQIATAQCAEIKTVAGDVNQFNIVAFFQVEQSNTGADGAFDENLQFPIFRCTREREVSGLFLTDAQHGDLAGYETDSVTVAAVCGHQIKRANVTALLTQAHDAEAVRVVLTHMKRV